VDSESVASSHWSDVWSLRWRCSALIAHLRRLAGMLHSAAVTALGSKPAPCPDASLAIRVPIRSERVRFPSHQRALSSARPDWHIPRDWRSRSQPSEKLRWPSRGTLRPVLAGLAHQNQRDCNQGEGPHALLSPTSGSAGTFSSVSLRSLSRRRPWCILFLVSDSFILVRNRTKVESRYGWPRRRDQLAVAVVSPPWAFRSYGRYESRHDEEPACAKREAPRPSDQDVSLRRYRLDVRVAHFEGEGTRRLRRARYAV
jgi:hypothetical protein